MSTCTIVSWIATRARPCAPGKSNILTAASEEGRGSNVFSSLDCPRADCRIHRQQDRQQTWRRAYLGYRSRDRGRGGGRLAGGLPGLRRRQRIELVQLAGRGGGIDRRA